MRHSILKFISLVLIVIMATGGLILSAQDGDTLNVIYWQAPSTMNAYLSGGTKEQEAMSITNEPLARFDPDGVLVPWLVTEIPTLENGGFAEDLTSITWNLRDDIVWSDGTPLTAEDVIFTWEYCTHPDMGCSYVDYFDDVVSVEASDPHTVVVNFGIPKPYPYNAFVSAASPIIQKAQFQDCLGANAANCTDQNFAPIGTGAYIVEEFRPNDVITFVANPNYRVEGQPAFDRLVLKGGGDAESAARAVFETGEADYAWNLQISPSILAEMEAQGLGTWIVGFGTSVERLILNHTNPDAALGDARSVYGDGSNPHPFLSNLTVRQALSMAIDRNIIAEQLYGKAGRATCNIFNNPPIAVSPNNDGCLVQDIAGANALLDEAGIVDTDGDGVRELDGVPLNILYQTSTNAVRQSTQALIKQWWSEIGVETELRNIDGSVFFGGDPASPDTYQKHFSDIEMFTSSASGTDPEGWFARWVCEPTAETMPGPDNGWLGRNVPRWCSPEYDVLFQTLTETPGIEARAELAIQLNDMIVQNYALIPLVHRGGSSAHSNTIEGVWINDLDSELWNIAEWTRADM